MSTAQSKSGQRSDASSRGGADTMKSALAKKQPASGWPAQPKPRDSKVKQIKKNSF
jgi:hypothetical protein